MAYKNAINPKEIHLKKKLNMVLYQLFLTDAY